MSILLQQYAFILRDFEKCAFSENVTNLTFLLYTIGGFKIIKDSSTFHNTKAKNLKHSITLNPVVICTALWCVEVGEVVDFFARKVNPPPALRNSIEGGHINISYETWDLCDSTSLVLEAETHTALSLTLCSSDLTGHCNPGPCSLCSTTTDRQKDASLQS